MEKNIQLPSSKVSVRMCAPFPKFLTVWGVSWFKHDLNVWISVWKAIIYCWFLQQHASIFACRYYTCVCRFKFWNYFEFFRYLMAPSEVLWKKIRMIFNNLIIRLSWQNICNRNYTLYILLVLKLTLYKNRIISEILSSLEHIGIHVRLKSDDFNYFTLESTCLLFSKNLEWYVRICTWIGFGFMFSTSPVHCSCKTCIERSIASIFSENIEGDKIFFGGFPVSIYIHFHTHHLACV